MAAETNRRRKLFHLTSGLEVGGRERVTLELAHRARADGWDVALVLFDSPFRDSERDLDPGDLPVFFLPRRSGVDLGLVGELARLLSRERVDLVHAHNDTAVFYAGAASLFAGRRPRILATFHTRPGHATRGARLSTRVASWRVSRLTAVSDEAARWLVDERWVPSCEVVWNGIDLAAFRPDGPTGGWRERLAIPPDALLVGHVARFDPIKRHEDLLEAARGLDGSSPPAFFALVGEGPERERIARAADSCGRVRFIPRIADVAAFLRELDLFVLCSEHEAAPRGLLEAMACGRAIVASDVGGIPTMTRAAGGAPCARLVPPRRPELLRAAIDELARDPAERQRLGARARERAGDFSLETQWRAYSRMYEEILAGARG